MINPTILAAQRIAEKLLDRVRLRRKRAYCALFLGEDGGPTPDAEIVLGDLMRFCRAAESSFDADPRVHALLEGRREVWLRLSGHLHIAEAEFVKYDPVKPQIDGDDYDD